MNIPITHIQTEPDQINDLGGTDTTIPSMYDLVFIEGMAYELQAVGEPYADGRRKAVLKPYRPF